MLLQAGTVRVPDIDAETVARTGSVEALLHDPFEATDPAGDGRRRAKAPRALGVCSILGLAHDANGFVGDAV